jgi:hydrogenase maturation protein HypF
MLRGSKGINDVVLSGGVFQNNFLLSRLVKKLQLQGFTVYTHKKVPCNDGGISLGQAVIAGERLKTCV